MSNGIAGEQDDTNQTETLASNWQAEPQLVAEAKSIHCVTKSNDAAFPQPTTLFELFQRHVAAGSTQLNTSPRGCQLYPELIVHLLPSFPSTHPQIFNATSLLARSGRHSGAGVGFGAFSLKLEVTVAVAYTEGSAFTAQS